MNFLIFAKNNRLIAGIILAVGLVAGLWIIWFIGATRYQAEVDNWIKVGRSEGYEISYDHREEFGFPRHTVLRFINVRWKNTNGVEFRAGDLDISADIWETRNFKAKFKGQVEIDVPAEGEHYSVVLAGENGEVSVRLSDAGTWEDCSIFMNTARFGRAPDYLFLADNIKLSAKRPEEEPKSNKETGLTLSTEVDNITLPAAMPPTFGPKMPKFVMDFRLMGPLPDFRKKNSVESWNKSNGLAEFDRLDLEWGPLLLNAKGAMNFDDDLQPEGAFAASIGHQEKVLETLAKAGFIATTQQDILNSAMRFLAKPADVYGQKGVEVPIAVQLGGFFLGPIKIFSFPPIEWE